MNDLEKTELSCAAFEFFWSATPEEIQSLGWRIGEKYDSCFQDDFIRIIIKPFVQGIASGAYCNFDNPVSIKIDNG